MVRRMPGRPEKPRRTPGGWVMEGGGGYMCGNGAHMYTPSKNISYGGGKSRTDNIWKDTKQSSTFGRDQ